jgi:FkbM family methyltransferase
VITLHQLRHGRFNSALLRKLLSFYFKEGESYRIHFGPMKGLRLRYDRSVNYHAILGLWDAEEYSFLARVLRDGGFLHERMVVADVGANLGLFSIWFSRLLEGTAHEVIAFEPAPDTFDKLEANVALNGARAIQTVAMACSDREGTTEFFIGHHHHVSSLLKDWAHAEVHAGADSLRVPTTTLDAFFASRDCGHPDFIKMDIEGGGVFALKGCHATLTTKRPLLWVESHTPSEDRAISHVLTTYGYCAYRFNNRSQVTHPTETHPDPNGVWGTLLIYPREQRERIEPSL